MEIKRLPLGTQQANCYIVSINNRAILIDPGYNAKYLLDELKNLNLELDKIILTHGHGDHIAAIPELLEKKDVPIYAHHCEEKLLLSPELNLSPMLGLGEISITADNLLEDGDEILFEDLLIKFFHTPGHTKGGICIKIGKYLFTGDTIFKGSIGRTDFPGGNFDELKNSIRNKIYTLDDNTILLPGHGEASNVKFEKSNNMFIR